MIKNQKSKIKNVLILLISTISSSAFSQTNTLPSVGNVGIGTSTPTVRLTVAGSTRIDSALVVKDSVVFNKSLRVDQNVRFLGETKMNQVKVTDEFVVNGLSKLNGEVKFTNIPLANNFSQLSFLMMNQNGMVKKGTGTEMVQAIQSLVYGTASPLPPLTVCDLEGYSPTWANGPSKIFVSCPNTKVGIGTSNPEYTLDCRGDAKTTGHLWVNQSFSVGTDLNTFSKVNILNTNRAAAIQVNTSGNTKEYQRLMRFEYDNPDTKIIEVFNTATNRYPLTLHANGQLEIDNGTAKILYLGTNGMFSLRNNSIETFRVEANGMVRARKIKVDSETWADYVFDDNYKLLPLDELEIFVKQNKHLPSIPSEKVMIEQGIDVTEMNVKMMEKIEELTLYLIQQNKEIEKLKAEIQRMQQN